MFEAADRLAALPPLTEAEVELPSRRRVLRGVPLVRVVADTNTLVSGLLWHGNPRRVLDAARADKLQMYTTAALLAELEEVLQRPKFAQRLALAGVTSRHTLVFGYAALARLVEPAEIAPHIIADPDDDAVLACAVAGHAEIIVSGDSHLLDLKEYKGIPIVTVAQLLTRTTPEQNDGL